MLALLDFVLEDVIGAYTGQPVDDDGDARRIVDENGIDYPRLFFDSSPQRHSEAWDLLSSFGDDSSLYYWRILASLRIMRLYRDDPDELSRTAELTTNKATLEELYHPEDETEVFEEPGDIAAATAAGIPMNGCRASPPASSRQTVFLRSSDRRAASTQPAVPAPTIT